jgi:hypothetical protein
MKMLGLIPATPTGGALSTFGYVGAWAPLTRTESTFTPLFEWAVPTMIDGVRP